VIQWSTTERWLNCKTLCTSCPEWLWLPLLICVVWSVCKDQLFSFFPTILLFSTLILYSIFCSKLGYLFFLESVDNFPQILLVYTSILWLSLPLTKSTCIIEEAGQVEKPSCSAVKGTVEWTNKHLLAQPIWSALSVYYFIQQFLGSLGTSDRLS